MPEIGHSVNLKTQNHFVCFLCSILYFLKKDLFIYCEKLINILNAIIKVLRKFVVWKMDF